MPDDGGLADPRPPSARADLAAGGYIQAVTTERTGVVLDRYDLSEPLGRGGMGTVWRAHDRLLGREVAVKELVLPEGVEDDELQQMNARVLREARAAARLSHPGSVVVYDVAQEAGRAYIVMELVEGRSLKEIVARDGPITPERAARIGLEVLDVLEAAHGRGIVHRDVKPANVLLDRSGRVKLTDFGIARLRDDSSLTMTGQVLGSPQYMSPEQASSQAVPESDLWGLGATLFFAVEGRPPFEGPNALSTVNAVVHGEAAPMTVKGRIASIIEDLLRKAPEERPAGDELRRRLDAAALAAVDRTEVDASGDGDAVMSTEELFAAIPPAVPEAEAPSASTPVPFNAPPSSDVPPPLQAPPRRRRSPWPVVAVIGLLLVVAGIGAALLFLPDDETAPTGRGGRRERPVESPSPEVTVPSDWVEYQDPGVGYTVSHPADWEVEVLDDTRTDFRDPSTGAYLRVDWTSTPGPSPVAAWESYSVDFAAEHEGYQEIRIERARFQGYRAAEWEFTFLEGGAQLHALDLGFVTGEYGFALFFQTPEEEWESFADEFEAFKTSFEAPE